MLISIIVPMYNSEKYISRCLESLIKQTYKNIEIIVVDDGSNDNSINIVTSLNDKRIRLYKKENSGVSLTRNFAIEKSKGDLLLFVDSDDYIDINMVAKLVKKVKILLCSHRPPDNRSNLLLVRQCLCKRRNPAQRPVFSDSPGQKILPVHSTCRYLTSQP